MEHCVCFLNKILDSSPGRLGDDPLILLGCDEYL